MPVKYPSARYDCSVNTDRPDMMRPQLWRQRSPTSAFLLVAEVATGRLTGLRLGAVLLPHSSALGAGRDEPETRGRSPVELEGLGGAAGHRRVPRSEGGHAGVARTGPNRTRSRLHARDRDEERDGAPGSGTGQTRTLASVLKLGGTSFFCFALGVSRTNDHATNQAGEM